MINSTSTDDTYSGAYCNKIVPKVKGCHSNVQADKHK